MQAIPSGKKKSRTWPSLMDLLAEAWKALLRARPCYPIPASYKGQEKRECDEETYHLY
jgi:hypothetical protein